MVKVVRTPDMFRTMYPDTYGQPKWMIGVYSTGATRKKKKRKVKVLKPAPEREAPPVILQDGKGVELT